MAPERNDSVAVTKRGRSIMPTIFDFLYREYCRARLAEMRKQLLLVPGPAVPEADGDGCHLGGSDSGFGDDTAAVRHETLHIN
jgi:hypothetical protein